MAKRYSVPTSIIANKEVCNLMFKEECLMKKFGKKLMALAMAGVLMCAPLTAFATEVDDESAAQGNITGSGDVEGIVNKDVFKVVLPTVATGDTTFNFILDPQGLIKATAGAKYTGATFDENAKGLYFANPQADSTTKYMASSPALTATNKGTVDVDVTLTATADAATLKDTTKGYTIGLAADDTFANDKTTSVYLALVSGSQTAALSADGATITDTLAAAPADAYEVTYDTTDSKYKYGLTAAAQAAGYTGFKSIDFNLTGACNTAADWAAAEDAAPSVEVAWTLEKHVETPKSDGTVDVTIQYKGADPAAGSIVFTKPNGSTWTPPASAYTSNIKINTASKTLVLAGSWLAGLKTNSDFGNGIYSVKIDGKNYAFELCNPTPESDGTTPVVLTYKGADPTAGSVVFTKPDSSTWTPPASAYGTNIVINSADKTFTLADSWLASIKGNFGKGTYSVEINGTSYPFILK